MWAVGLSYMWLALFPTPRIFTSAPAGCGFLLQLVGWPGKGSTFRLAPCGIACPLPPLPCSRTYERRTPSKCFHFNLQSLQNFNQLSPLLTFYALSAFLFRFPIFRFSLHYESVIRNARRFSERHKNFPV